MLQWEAFQLVITVSYGNKASLYDFMTPGDTAWERAQEEGPGPREPGKDLISHIWDPLLSYCS